MKHWHGIRVMLLGARQTNQRIRKIGVLASWICGRTFKHLFLLKYYILEDTTCIESKLAHFWSGFSTFWWDSSPFAQKVSRKIASWNWYESVAIPFYSDFSQNIKFLRKQLAWEVNRPILEVGFQPFGDIPHRLLRK